MIAPENDPEHKQAHETLAYIRQTMESASSFTAISGVGMIGVGIVGLVASAVSFRLEAPAPLRVWLPAATLAIAIAMIGNGGKARRLGVALWSGAIRKLAWVMAPALAAGAMLTWALWEADAQHLLPGMWLAVYGAAVTAGGTLSLRAIRWLGLLCLMLGLLALLRPEGGPILLAAGFGAAHIGFGARLFMKYGG